MQRAVVLDYRAAGKLRHPTSFKVERFIPMRGRCFKQVGKNLLTLRPEILGRHLARLTGGSPWRTLEHQSARTVFSAAETLLLASRNPPEPFGRTLRAGCYSALARLP